MKKLRKGLMRSIFFFPLLFLIILFGIGTMQIVSRFFFSFPLTWGEEAMRLFFIFLVFFSAVVVTNNHEHIGVDILDIFIRPRISPNLWDVYKRGILVLQFVIFCLCAFGCFQMAKVRWLINSQTIFFWKIGYMYMLVGFALAQCAVISLIHVFIKTPKD
jgi:TRAP-type C4-dicarboxylate transport system permease small subunit